MSSRSRRILSAVALIFYCKLLMPWSAEAQGYFYAIAHMTNNRKAVDWAVSQGANALEADLRFDADGSPKEFRHGMPCDCTCMSTLNVILGFGGVCSALGWIDPCDARTNAADLLRHIAAKPSIALLVIDSKVTWQSNTDGGRKVVELLESELFGRGFRGNVIIGVPSLDESEWLRHAALAAWVSSYRGRIYFTIDGEGRDVTGVLEELVSLPTTRIAYGTGISSCASGDYVNATLIGAANKGAGVISLNYIWTLDKKESMNQYIDAGAQGIITNYPDRLVGLLRERQIPLARAGTEMPARTDFDVSVITQTPSCNCSFKRNGCTVSWPAPAGLACHCNLAFGCTGIPVACEDPFSPFCTTPGTARENCLQGGGNCEGYLADVCRINVGPIWSQTHANQICPGTCSPQIGSWTGHWGTTVPNSMSFCQCQSTVRTIDAGLIMGQQDAENKCPQVCGNAHGEWTGHWWATVPNERAACQCAGCIP